MDFDGDELNLIDEPNIIAAAKRTISNHSILPLFYDAQKAGKQKFTPENRYACLMMAHEFGGAAIGGVSNTLTKLWNSHQDITMAARICCFNNYIIDAAKTGKVINYPEDIAKPINQMKHGRMPWFFQFTPNGRSGDIKCCEKPTDNISIMNKIALKFEQLKKAKLSLGYDDLDDFNPYMLIRDVPTIDIDVFPMFDREIFNLENTMSKIKQNKIRSYYESSDHFGKLKEKEWWQNKLSELYNKMLEIFKDPVVIYNSLVIEMFSKRAMSETRKSQFWQLFGDVALENIKYNLAHYYKCSIPGCNMKVPNWDTMHELHHQTIDEMHKKCEYCGVIFEFKGKANLYCPDCQKGQNERNKRAKAKYKQWEKGKRKIDRMDRKTEYECDSNEIFLPLLLLCSNPV